MVKKDKNIQVKLIANPGAGNPDDTAHNLELVTGYLEKSGLKVDLALAKPAERATRIARNAVKDGYKIVIAMGGDGTIEAVMRGMIGSKAHMGIIPTGTRNNIARSVGISKNLEEACALIATDTALKLDMGQVTTRKGKKFVFFEMATVGLSAAMYPAASKIGDGKLSNIKLAALTLIHQEPRPKVFLTLDDDSRIDVETMVVMVSNTPVFGENFLVAPEASMQDGLLDVSVYPDFNKAELLRYYAEVMDGGYSGDGKVQRYQARKMKIKTYSKMDVMADGVALGRGTIKIKVRPGALRVITTQENLALEKSRTDREHRHKVPVAATKTHSRRPVRKTVELQAVPATQVAGTNHRKKDTALTR